MRAPQNYVGPVSTAGLMQLKAHNYVAADTYVWASHLNGWSRLGRCAGAGGAAGAAGLRPCGTGGPRFGRRGLAESVCCPFIVFFAGPFFPRPPVPLGGPRLPICCERGLDQPGSTSCGGDAARSNSGDDERRGPSMLKERRWRPRNFG